MDEQYPPRRPTQAYEPEIAPTSKVAMGLREVILAIIAVAGAAGTATLTYWRLDNRVERMEEHQQMVATKADVERIQVSTRTQVDRMVRTRVKRFLVRCPRDALRGSGKDVECPAVLLREDADDVE